MPRIHRNFSRSKTYHIVIKGLDDTDFFYDNEDRVVFLEKIQYSKHKFKYEVYAYCLMTNHVHMVIKVDNDNLSKAMQSLIIRYSRYFNKKYDRKGNFIQNRFFSKNIENQKYFLDVCRYVHRNPEKAGIGKTCNYKWSSYHEYLGKEDIINKKVLMHYLDNSIENFIHYTNKEEDINEIMNLADFEMTTSLSDDELIEIIKKIFNLKTTNAIIKYFKNTQNRIKLKELKDIRGISQRQISRITMVNRELIRRIFRKK